MKFLLKHTRIFWYSPVCVSPVFTSLVCVYKVSDASGVFSVVSGITLVHSRLQEVFVQQFTYRQIFDQVKTAETV